MGAEVHGLVFRRGASSGDCKPGLVRGGAAFARAALKFCECRSLIERMQQKDAYMTGNASLNGLSKLERLRATGNLPSPKGVALAIMRATQGDDISIAELGRIIKTDPAFVGRLIKAANGHLGYGRHPIASVQDALMVLGMPAVRALALGFSLLSSHRSGACQSFDYEGFWASSLMRATAMQAITLRTRAAPADEAYCVGLLSRIGELAMATLYPEQYGDLLRLSAAGSDELVAREQAAFALDHRELSGLMLADWGMPRTFAQVVAVHGQPEHAWPADDSREATLCRSLALAAELGRLCETERSEHARRVPSIVALASSLQIDGAELNETCDAAIRDWSEWSSLLQLAPVQIDAFSSLVERSAVAAPEPVTQAAPAVAAPTDVAVPPPAKRHMRVLVVESDAAVRASIRTLLHDAGHEVHEVDTIAQAAEAAILTQPHLMIVEWSLSDGSGLKLVERLRQTRVGRSIYVLVLTSHENEQRLVEAFECGVDDFITKPINGRVLLARMRAGLRVVKLHEEIERDREEIRHFASELAVSNRRLQDVALTDVLTALPNRRYFIDRVEQEWSAASRSQRPMVCMAIEVDGLAQIRSTYGQMIGDAVVKHVGSVLKQALRTHDVLARTDDGVFSVLCPDTDVQGAGLVAERLRQQVEATPFRVDRLQLRIAVQIGLAQRNSSMSAPETLISEASSELSASKGAVAGTGRAAGFALFSEREGVVTP
ncbi:HDOD domain-containing protein [Niveibacterium microcysteis]|uniref:HDOD domain-containing protein n=1 Tax=Niveibacterium microcysteis TaxID=2811415 RepID=A0ABX7M131_9RHOO|nr:HDOD domain-containing protein [Niveibacterium microcysteis]